MTRFVPETAGHFLAVFDFPIITLTQVVIQGASKGRRNRFVLFVQPGYAQSGVFTHHLHPLQKGSVEKIRPN